MSSSRLKEIEDSQEDMSVLEKSPQMSPTSTPDTRAEEKKGLSFDLETRLRSVLQQENTNATRRELGVLFEGLRVVGVGGAESYQMTFSSYFNPKIWLEKVRNARYPQVRDIISSFDGLVRPGEMLLVLGRPGSGCTTFLKTLANRRDEFHATMGEVFYDSFTTEEIAKHYRGDLQYCAEDDIHFPTLTVEDTIRFAVRSRAPHVRPDNQSREFYINTVTDVLLTVFGLKNARNTFIGDTKVRGVSGGEKKRVSIAETLATRGLINLWDNSTRGLDSSTALEVLTTLRTATNISRTSTVMSIYQAADSLYRLFDKVCVIYEGKMVYYGSANLARQYFFDMGYEPANRQTTADFLVAVTDSNGRNVRVGHEKIVPRTAEEFAAYFRSSKIAKINRDDMESYRREFVESRERASRFTSASQEEHVSTSRKGSPYILSVPLQARAVMARRARIIRGDIKAQVVNTIVFVTRAVIVGSVFVQSPADTAHLFSRGSVLFISIMFISLIALAEIPALFKQRPVVVKHEKAAMYHPFIENAALTIVDIPITFINIFIYGIVLYFMVGLQASASQFFIFLLFLLCISLTMKLCFRSIAALSGSPAPAQGVAGLLLLMFFLYTGYVIPLDSQIGALKWISWLSPLRYGFEAMVTNELHTLKVTCSNMVPSGLGYESVNLSQQVCSTAGSTAGQTVVDGNAYAEIMYSYSYEHLWRNFGVLLTFAFGLFVMLLAVTERNFQISEIRAGIKFKRGAKTVISQRVQDKEASDGSRGSNPLQEQAVSKPSNTHQPAPMMEILSWQNLKYAIPISKGETRLLLNDISGYVAPGKLTALMGETGAGKTTLLNVLASRVDTGVVTGYRFINGRGLPVDFQAQTGFCQQTDTHVAQATVKEAILFSALLRQPRSVSLSEKTAYVEKCLSVCGLEDFEDAVVGSLNGELSKRLTIAIELAAKPKLLLFLDEPTSGLDSQSAWAIMTFLRSLADSGQAILCTIHQPSAELFQLFDRLLLLQQGGETVYFGDLGPDSNTMISYMERSGARKCDPQENPAEYMLEAIGAGASASVTAEWYDVWKSSPEYVANLKEIERIHEEARTRPPIETERSTEFSTRWIYQLKTLLIRNFIFFWRDPAYLISKILLGISGGLFIGFSYWKANDSIQGTQNKLFAIFMSLVIALPLANQLQVPFIEIRSIYEIRERPSKMYHWTALVTSQILVELPCSIFASSLYFLCWFFPVGFSSSSAGYLYLIKGVMNPIFFVTMAQAVAAMSPDATIAALLFAAFFSLLLTFTGVLQPFRSLGWWQWMWYVTPYKWLNEGCAAEAFGRRQITCSPQEYVTLIPPSGSTCSQYLQNYIQSAGGYVLNPNDTRSCHYCSYRTTNDLLASNFNYYPHPWRNFVIGFGFIAINIVAIFALTWLFQRIRTRKSSSLLQHTDSKIEARTVAQAESEK